MLNRFTRFVSQNTPSAKSYPTSGNVIRHAKPLWTRGKRTHTALWSFAPQHCWQFYPLRGKKPSTLNSWISTANVSPIADADVGLAWSDNANNEAGFQVERGKKTKGVVQYTKAGGAGSAYSNVVEVRIKGGGKGQS